MNFAPEFFVYLIGSFPDPTLSRTLIFSERFDYADIQTDADFELKRLVMFASQDTAVPTTESSRFLPNFNFNIRDDATGRTLFNGYVGVSELFGDGRIPFVLPTSHFFQRGSRAQMMYDRVNPGPDFDNCTCWLGLVGSKHFERASS